jgi:NAD(P)-dependent dehydrogenase (short-subunit alcohol dehydrogenase family)
MGDLMSSIDATFDTVDLEGRTVIVTGAASGIGAATARLLHAEGAQPVLADVDLAPLAALASQLDDALAMAADVTDMEQVRRLVASTIERYGRVDGLVNNAGISAHYPIAEVDVAGFERALRVNVLGPVTMMLGVLPIMRAARFGRIVNVSSGSTNMAPVGVGPYAATKAAVNMLSDVARRELAEDGVAVSVVLPSITATQFRGGYFKLGDEPFPGLVTHSAEYPAGAIVRALRTGEESIAVPHGPEQPGAFAIHP